MTDNINSFFSKFIRRSQNGGCEFTKQMISCSNFSQYELTDLVQYYVNMGISICELASQNCVKCGRHLSQSEKPPFSSHQRSMMGQHAYTLHQIVFVLSLSLQTSPFNVHV